MKKTLRISSSEIEYRKEDGKPDVIAGIAAPFNSDSVSFGDWVERYAPGAFTKTLINKPDVIALINHNTDLPVGRTTAGNLQLFETARGLEYTFTPPDTTLGRDLKYNIEHRIWKSISIGFVINSFNWTKEGGKNIRNLTELDLWEMSFVSFPAYPDTTAEMRAITEEGEIALAVPPSVEVKPTHEPENLKRKIEILKRK